MWATGTPASTSITRAKADDDFDADDDEDLPTESDRELNDDSKVESLCSSNGPSEASAPDSPTQSDRELRDDSEGGEHAPRAKTNTFSVYSNVYFAVEQYPKYQDVKITQRIAFVRLRASERD